MEQAGKIKSNLDFLSTTENQANEMIRKTRGRNGVIFISLICLLIIVSGIIFDWFFVASWVCISILLLAILLYPLSKKWLEKRPSSKRVVKYLKKLFVKQINSAKQDLEIERKKMARSQGEEKEKSELKFKELEHQILVLGVCLKALN